MPRAGRRTRMLLAGLLVLAVGLGGVVALAGSRPLRAAGPGEVAGTIASAAFTVGGVAIRQVRYVDRRELSYSFTLVNTSRVPVRVVGWAPAEAAPSLLRPTGLSPGSFRLGPDGEFRVTLRMLMTGCERLSARAGSLLGTARFRVRLLGVVPRTVEVKLPERLRVGSPREASCPRATATSRPPG